MKLLMSQEKIDGATREQLAAHLTMVAARLLTLETAANVSHGLHPRSASQAESAARFLTVKQAAEVTGLPRRFFYDNAPRLPFALRLSPRRLRFDEVGLREWMLGQQEAQSDA